MDDACDPNFQSWPGRQELVAPCKDAALTDRRTIIQPRACELRQREVSVRADDRHDGADSSAPVVPGGLPEQTPAALELGQPEGMGKLSGRTLLIGSSCFESRRGCVDVTPSATCDEAKGGTNVSQRCERA